MIADNLHVSYDNLIDEKTTQTKTRKKKSTAEKVCRDKIAHRNVNSVH